MWLPLAGLPPPLSPRGQGGGIRGPPHSVPGRCHGPPIITSPAWCNSPTRQTRTRERSPCCVLEDTPLRASTPLKGQRNPHPGVPGTEPASPRTPPPGRHCGPPAWGRDPTTSDLRTAPSGGAGGGGPGARGPRPAGPRLPSPSAAHAECASASRVPDMSRLQALCSGLPLRPLPENRGRRAGVPHAPVRTPGLSPAEEQVRGWAPSCRAVCPLGGPAGQCPRPALSRVCQTASHPISLILCPAAALGCRTPAPIY